jgi:N-acetyl-gamma-glutamylphosphate reductase
MHSIHISKIDQVLTEVAAGGGESVEVIFTPHLAPTRGAAGIALRNINLMLGCAEQTGRSLPAFPVELLASTATTSGTNAAGEAVRKQ